MVRGEPLPRHRGKCALGIADLHADPRRAGGPARAAVHQFHPVGALAEEDAARLVRQVRQLPADLAPAVYHEVGSRVVPHARGCQLDRDHPLGRHAERAAQHAQFVGTGHDGGGLDVRDRFGGPAGLDVGADGIERRQRMVHRRRNGGLPVAQIVHSAGHRTRVGRRDRNALAPDGLGFPPEATLALSGILLRAGKLHHETILASGL